MKKYCSSLFIFCLPLIASAQSAYYDVRKGNENYQNNDFKAAEELYRAGMNKDPELLESAYNLGSSLYRQGNFEDASKYFSAVATKSENKLDKAKAYHNLGNSLLKSEKLEESINAYKNALMNNPKDEESRYNLAYAQQMLQQQQQQQEQQQQEDQKQDNQEEKEQQEQQNQDQNQEEKENEEQQEQNQEQEQEEKQQQEQQQQQQKEQQVSREDAERILEALNQKEKEVQEKLKKKKGKAVKINIEKDW